MPEGSYGAFVFIEGMQDEIRSTNNQTRHNWLMAIPHEIGHQFGIQGDGVNTGWGIMSYGTGVRSDFHPEHINLMRWRVSSPGKL